MRIADFNLVFIAIVLASLVLIVLNIYKYSSSTNNLKFQNDTVCKDIKNISRKNYYKNSSTLVSKRYICPQFVNSGRLGNLIFIYASNYGIARLKGMPLYIDKSCPLLKLFKIKTTVSSWPNPCRKTKQLKEYLPVAYDKALLNFTNDSDVQVLQFLQSYHYFDSFSKELRQIYQFRDDIQAAADSLVQKFRQEHGVLRNASFTLIGVHVRRGDLLNKFDINFGKTVATKEYLEEAIFWYRKRYQNLLFIVASDGMKWTKENMPKDILVSYLEGNSPEIDLATISSCNHFIMTVGTFGWWGGWLTGGNVIYYKWPAKENSQWRKLFIYPDYYYPNWIGL